MVQQRVEGVHVHVVTAGHHIRVRCRQISDATVTLSVQGRRGTNDQNLNVVLRRHVHNVRQVQTRTSAGQTQINVKGRRSNNKAVISTGNEAAARLLEPACIQLLATFIGGGKVICRDGCGGLRGARHNTTKPAEGTGIANTGEQVIADCHNSNIALLHGILSSAVCARRERRQGT